jgi:hypothetical protein
VSEGAGSTSIKNAVFPRDARLIPDGIEEVLLQKEIPWSLVPSPVARTLRRLLVSMNVIQEIGPTFSLDYFAGLTHHDLTSLSGGSRRSNDEALAYLPHVVDALLGYEIQSATTPQYPGLTSAPASFRLTKDTLRLYGVDDSDLAIVKRHHLETPHDLIVYLAIKPSKDRRQVTPRLAALAKHLDDMLQTWEPATLDALIQARFGTPTLAWPQLLHDRFGLRSEAVTQTYPKFEQTVTILERRLSGATLEEIAKDCDLTRQRVRQIVVKYAKALDPAIASAMLHTRGSIKSDRGGAELDLDQDTSHYLASVIQTSPGISLSTLSKALEPMSEAQVRRLIPKNLRKFVADYQIKIDHSVRRWTPDDMLAAVQAAGTYHFPLSAPQYDHLVHIGEIVGPGSQTVAKRFGTWKAACRAAGVEPTGHGREHYDRKWSREEIVSILAEYLLDPTTTGGFDDYEQWRLRQVNAAPSGALIRNEMDSWSSAMTCALVDVASRGPLDSGIYASSDGLSGTHA